VVDLADKGLQDRALVDRALVEQVLEVWLDQVLHSQSEVDVGSDGSSSSVPF